METWQAWLLIALILGVIVSNLMILKHTANMKIPPLVQKDKYQVKPKSDADDNDGADSKSTDQKSG